MSSGTKYSRLVYHGVNHRSTGGGMFYLEGYLLSPGFEYQEIKSYDNDVFVRVLARHCHGGVWYDWYRNVNAAFIEDNLTSDMGARILSANQGRILNEKIKDIYYGKLSFKVVSVNGLFDGVYVEDGETWIIIAQRPTTNSTCVVIGNFYGKWKIRDIIKDSEMSYEYNDQGTIQFYYNGSGASLVVVGIRLYPHYNHEYENY